MAFRRSKQKQQVIEKLQEIAPPGETFIACVHCETGPSPWLGILFDEVPLVGTIVFWMRKFYFVTLTNTTVVVNTMNRMTNRPGDVVYSIPREQFQVTAVKRAAFWSSMYVQFPGQQKPTRLNIDRYWRSEFDQLIAGLPQAQIPAQAQAPSEQPVQ